MPGKKKSEPSRFARIASSVLLIALSIILIDAAMDIWPAVGVQSELCKEAESMPLAEREPVLNKIRKAHKITCRYAGVPVTRVNLEGVHTFLSPDQAMFGLVAMFAAVGALIRSLRAVASAASGRSETESSIRWNLLRPLIAALIAFVVYVILRAMFVPAGTLASVNPYGFVAISALIGLFCDELLCWGSARGRSLLGKSK